MQFLRWNREDRDGHVQRMPWCGVGGATRHKIIRDVTVPITPSAELAESARALESLCAAVKTARGGG